MDFPLGKSSMGRISFGKNVSIGKSAVITGSGIIGDGVTIGENVIIEGNVRIGRGTRIDHGVIMRGRVRIGRGNWIYPFCVIGTGPQDVSLKERDVEDSVRRFGSIEIGDNNVIREFATIHLPAKKKTVIGSGCYILAYGHFAHDVRVHDNVTMANKTTLGGYVEVHDHANIGFNCQIHPHCRIGAYSMIGMGNSITKDVLPFSLINRMQFTKVNRMGLERNNVKKQDVKNIEILYQKNFPPKVAKTWYEKEIRGFVRRSDGKVYTPVFNEGRGAVSTF